MKILHKYVLKEHLGPFLFAFSALTSILMLQVVAKQFGNLVGKGLPATIIAEFFALSLPYTLALTLPMAVLVATLYAFSRLASENEITALKASGVGLSRILAPVLVAAFGVTLFMLGFNDQILPRSNHQLSSLMTDIAQTKPTFALREQVINEVVPNKFYLRANHIEASRLMREVTIYDMSDASRRRTIIADSGTVGMAPNRADLLMTLYNGVMQDVPTQNPDQLQRLFFKTDLIRVKGVANQFQKTSAGESRSAREQSVCQMQGDVDKSTRDYESARQTFEQNVAAARTYKVTLDSSVYKLHPKAAPKRTLAGSYCALLKILHVPELRPPADTDSLVAQRGRFGGPPGMNVTPRSPTPPRLLPGQRMPKLPPNLPPAVAQRLRAQLGIPDTPATANTGPGMANGAQGAVTGPPPSYMVPSIVQSAQFRMQDAQRTINNVDVEIHKKFALAAACFVFVLIGAPIALRFPRGGVGLTIGASLLVFAIYYIGLIGGQSLGSNGIVPPWIAMWAANAIFGVIGIFLVSRMGKEGSTARGGDAGELFDNMKRWFRARLQGLGLVRERRETA